MSSTLRIGGLATGIDVDSIVKETMQAKRIPQDKLKQQKQILEWQRDDYRAINTVLRTFRDKVFNMKLQSTFLARKATSSDETVLTASAGATAAPGMYTVKVNQLAEGVTVGSQVKLPDEDNGSGGTRTLAEQFSLSGTLSFTLEGANGYKDFSFDTATANINSVVSAINSANLGISASYDAVNNRFFLTTTSTGSNAFIKVTNDTSNFISGDGSGTDNTLKMKLIAGTKTTGKDAEVDFGDTTGLKFASNTFTINGITINAKKVQTSAVTINVTADTDAVFNSIKDFVNSYNDTIAKINAELSETRYKDYVPLTDTQKKEMSDEEIKKWEEMARSGLLRNDPLLRGILGTMRTTLSSSVSNINSRYTTLAAVGITTGSYAEGGKLYIDETKLRAALQADPEGVMKLFTNSTDVAGEKGLALRLYDDVNNAINQLGTKAGYDSTSSLYDNSDIAKRMRDLDQRIEQYEERLQKEEDRLWKQFTALEKAVAQMNAQSAWLSQQFGGGGSK
ncbi:flagellar hook-associated protein 2 [Desulfurispora thermophila]|uniref:flagellar hook-associated protein 2 n=1 Tax=Desulfurispora thermophila TaxID=265470 RepID=UPI000378C1DD|nr:flagellar hook-associated protein 2 [Desulfurispora thermophila]